MRRDQAGKTELKLAGYHCNHCNYDGKISIQTDGIKHPPTSVACNQCRKPVALPPNKWVSRTAAGPLGVPNVDG